MQAIKDLRHLVIIGQRRLDEAAEARDLALTALELAKQRLHAQQVRFNETQHLLDQAVTQCRARVMDDPSNPFNRSVLDSQMLHRAEILNDLSSQIASAELDIVECEEHFDAANQQWRKADLKLTKILYLFDETTRFAKSSQRNQEEQLIEDSPTVAVATGWGR